MSLILRHLINFDCDKLCLDSAGHVNGESSAVLDYGLPYQSPDRDGITPTEIHHQGELEDGDEEETALIPADDAVVSLQTPIHLSIVNRHEAVTQAFIDHKGI